jgi:hypothetical protein
MSHTQSAQTLREHSGQPDRQRPPVASRSKLDSTQLTVIAAVAVALVIRIVYWIMTKRTFEDALITLTHARNAAHGLGLTSHYGEGKVQGFTSAISVLLPLVGELLVPGSGLALLRVASLFGSALAVICAAAIARRLSVTKWALVFVLAYIAFDYNSILYGMGGMETQLAITCLLACVYFSMRGSVWGCGLCYGAALLARPDFLLFLPAALLAWLVIDYRKCLRIAGIAALVLTPWLTFTWLYYGSPVPQTIRAKQQAYFNHPPIGHTPASIWHFVSFQLEQHLVLWRLMLPFTESSYVLRTPLSYGVTLAIGIVIAMLVALGALATVRVRGWWPAIAYVIFFLLYVTFLLPHSFDRWYTPPCTTLIMLLVGAGLARLSSFGQSQTAAAIPVHPPHRFLKLAPAGISAVLSLVLVLLFAWQIPIMFPLDRKVQEIEQHVRTPLGHYLHQVVHHGEAVTSESAGYVGYYSEAKLYDYPGLTSPTVYDALKKLKPDHRTLIYMVQALRPAWLVLRPSELEKFHTFTPSTAAEYRVMRQFKWGPPEFSRLGVTYEDIDTDFFVLKRNRSPISTG